MTRIAYTVVATLPNARSADEYVAWLEDGHIDAVIAGGAHSAMIVRYTPESGEAGPHQVEVRYVFSTRELFDRYVEHFAPGLRADGLKRFGGVPGIAFERRTGVIV